MKIADVWFRSPRDIRDVYQAITGETGKHDEENRFEWVQGNDPESGLHLNISRVHGHIIPPNETDIRIMLGDALSLQDESLHRLVERILAFESGPVSVGRWDYIRGNEWDKIVAKTFPDLDNA